MRNIFYLSSLWICVGPFGGCGGAGSGVPPGTELGLGHGGHAGQRQGGQPRGVQNGWVHADAKMRDIIV